MGLYDYGARWYDAAIGRFVGTDRFAEKYYPLSPYGYVAGNPVLFVDVNGDSIKYANADIQAYVERYSSETVTRGNGKVRLNRNYDPEFAKIINALEKSEFTFRFTDDGSGLNSETLGQVESTGDSKAFDVIVPDHSKTSKSSEQDIFGGRGAILAEKTYHAFQVSEGHVVASTQGKGFVKGTSAP